MIIGLQHTSVFVISNRTPNSLVNYPGASPLPPNPMPDVLDSQTSLAGGGYPGSPSLELDVTDTTGLIANAQLWFMFLPIVTPFTTTTSPQYTLAVLDSSNFDDIIDNTTYVFRMEEIKPNRVPTVRRVVLEYRDLGLCTVTTILSGTNDNKEIVFATLTKQIGNANPTGTILTEFFDITLTCFRPQLAFTRNPGGGPLSIISTTLIGEVEEITL